MEVHSPVSHTLYDPELLLSRSGGKPPLTMQSFTKLVTAGGPFGQLLLSVQPRCTAFQEQLRPMLCPSGVGVLSALRSAARPALGLDAFKI